MRILFPYALIVIRFQYNLCMIHVQFLYYVTYYDNTIPICSHHHTIPVQFIYYYDTIYMYGGVINNIVLFN